MIQYAIYDEAGTPFTWIDNITDVTFKNERLAMSIYM
jgi:hypothetical protein